MKASYNFDTFSKFVRRAKNAPLLPYPPTGQAEMAICGIAALLADSMETAIQT
jgi:hypothetical protein